MKVVVQFDSARADNRFKRVVGKWQWCCGVFAVRVCELIGVTGFLCGTYGLCLASMIPAPTAAVLCRKVRRVAMIAFLVVARTRVPSDGVRMNERIDSKTKQGRRDDDDRLLQLLEAPEQHDSHKGEHNGRPVDDGAPRDDYH